MPTSGTSEEWRAPEVIRPRDTSKATSAHQNNDALTNGLSPKVNNKPDKSHKSTSVQKNPADNPSLKKANNKSKSVSPISQPPKKRNSAGDSNKTGVPKNITVPANNDTLPATSTSSSNQTDTEHSSRKQVNNKSELVSPSSQPPQVKSNVPHVSPQPSLNKSINAAQNKPANAAGWVAACIIVGVLFILWYASSTETPTQSPHKTAQPPAQQTPKKTGVATYQKPISRPAESSRSVTYENSVQKTPSARQTGQIAFSAHTFSADNQRYQITNQVKITLKDQATGKTISTNNSLPMRWSNIVAGRYLVNIEASGYKHMPHSQVDVQSTITKDIALRLDPLPSKIRFDVTPTNAQPSIFIGTNYLGKASEQIELPPFIVQTLSFRAPGWRDASIKLRLPEPGKSYRHTVAMEKIQSKMLVSVDTKRGNPPKSGMLKVGNGTPIKVNLPFEGSIPYEGAATVYLDVDGYIGISSQKVEFVDGKVAEIIYEMERLPFIKRLFR